MRRAAEGRFSRDWQMPVKSFLPKNNFEACFEHFLSFILSLHHSCRSSPLLPLGFQPENLFLSLNAFLLLLIVLQALRAHRTAQDYGF
jgi:hypothetical protein